MAWTTPKTWASGYVVLAADLNTHLRDNLNVTAPAVLTTAGDILYASGANTPARLAKSTTSTQYLANTGSSNIPEWNEVALTTGVSGILPHENGGLGFDAAAVTTNDAIGGASSGVLEIKVPVTQAEAEAGTATRFCLWSPARVKEAIDAIGGITFSADVFSKIRLYGH